MKDHTPTPWQVAPLERLIIRDVPGMCGGESYYTVAEARFHSLLPLDEAAANAAFIVTAANNHAPMLKSLELCAKLFELLATKLDGWAVESRDGGWSTHQVDGNIKAAHDCRRYASHVRAALPTEGES